MKKIVLSLLIGSTLGSAIIQPTVMVYASEKTMKLNLLKYRIQIPKLRIERR